MWLHYYDNGLLKLKAKYKDGELNGYVTQYYKSGNISCKYRYKDNEINGTFTEYYNNGQIMGVTFYRNGQKQGKSIRYYKDGSKKDLKEWFNELWTENTEDAKKEILAYIEAIYKENSPEQVYYKTLYHLFEEKIESNELEDIEKNKKFIETKIWKTLYPFQKDAVKSAINKMNKYNG